MPTIRTKGWVQVEGCEIKDLYRQYGTLSNIPTVEQHIYYGHPEIQINNPQSYTHSAVYTVKSIQDYFGYSQIHEIDENWTEFLNNIQTFQNQNEIDIDDPDTAYYYVNKPFTVDKSCVIFYDDSTKSSVTGSKYSKYIIILVDEYAVPSIVDITAKYKGDEVPVGEIIDIDQLEVTAIYDDGNSTKIDTGYIIEPADKIVTKLGSNVFTVYYTDAENDVNRATFVVHGCRNLQYITGYWDGDLIAYNKEAPKKFFVIIAHYSDDTEAIVTDFEFPNTNIVTKQNEGLITVYYQGHECEVQVTPYEVKQSRLIAYYNGPNVEVNHNFQTSYLSIKIYYSSDEDISKSYYENVNIEDCILEDTLVKLEGVNSFDISYNGQLGLISTSFTVIGIVPDLKPTDIQATYNGPGVYQGDTFDLERITCNIYYNNGVIKTVKNFSVNTNFVDFIGENQITVTYTENTTTLTDIIFINGLERDSTTANNIFPTSLKNNYPSATVINNRYRGPAEGVKVNDYANMIIKNIKELYNLFAKVETQYNDIIGRVAGNNCVKILTLNNVSFIENQVYNILKDDHYTTGIYKSEDIVE